MAAGIPPPPINSPTGSFYWLEWYTNLTNFLNGTNIPWSSINFSTANISDIPKRDHNTLTNIQGGNPSSTYPATGNAWHLIGKEYIGQITSTGTATLLPTSWTVTGTNPYTVTHNLNFSTLQYVVLVVPTSGTGNVQQVTLSANSFTVQLSAANSWQFVLTQGS